MFGTGLNAVRLLVNDLAYMGGFIVVVSIFFRFRLALCSGLAPVGRRKHRGLDSPGLFVEHGTIFISEQGVDLVFIRA